MPQNAMREVDVDYCVPVAELAGLLTRLVKEEITGNTKVMKDEKTKIEIDIAAEETALKKGVLNLGELSQFACPECHGVLTKILDDNLARYRCHTGHAYSADTLMATLTEKIEDSLYSVIRGMDENIMLLNHIGDHYAEANNLKLAATYFKKAKEAEERSKLVRKAVLTHEHLSKDKLLEEAEEE
jgi:two-component system chemotaxis response regulator CheB